MISATIKIFGEGNKVLSQFTTEVISKPDDAFKTLHELWNIKESFNRLFNTKIDIQLTETNSIALEPPKDKK
jgi:hypothetical protein